MPDEPTAASEPSGRSESGAAPLATAANPPRPRGGAAKVFAGVLLSRILGFVREGAFARYLGAGPHADALSVAFRIPNLVQNLLGEGVLSASFIPVYSRLLEEKREEEAGRFAGAIFGLLLAAAAGLALLGIICAKPLVLFLAPGFARDAARVAAGLAHVDRFALTVEGVRILFPMTGLMVLGVWALAVLNSHRRFFLPYFAPVLWNAAIIAALAFEGWTLGLSLTGRGSGAPHGGFASSLVIPKRLYFAACWGALVGGLLQFGVQLPGVAAVLKGFRFSFSTRVEGVREALRAWGPVVAGRGVVQLAGYVDYVLASLLKVGAPSIDRYAQTFYMLPISLFGMSVAASELPELARLRGEENREALLARVQKALRSVAFLNVPTVVGYFAFGLAIVGVFRRGAFGLDQNWLVYLVLCGYATGILATTSSRLLQNTFYALGETKVPARIAVVRVATSAAVAIPLMWWLDHYPLTAAVRSIHKSPLYLGPVGLALASGCGAWMELAWLRRALRKRLPEFTLPFRHEAKMAGLALGAVVPGAAAWYLLPHLPILVTAGLVVATFGGSYLLLAHLAGLEEMSTLTGGLRRRLAR
jgi:putative peptidoglycan lipid II flippase